MEQHEIESAIEGILFAAGEPVEVDRLTKSLGVDRESVVLAAETLAGRYRYERRGVRVVNMDKSWQMVSAPEQADLIRRTLEERKPAPLSKPALEVLALIAYYQPITRADIDKVRGVDSAYTVSTLQDKNLIEEAGRLDVIGRPILYRTTTVFLRCFGLTKLSELPELNELDGQLVMDGALTGETS